MGKTARTIGIITAVLAITVGLASCTDTGRKEDLKDGAYEKTGTGTPAGELTETETYIPQLKAGDRVEQKTATNGATAYDEMYYNLSVGELNKRVVVEYNGKTIKLVDMSVSVGFSPDGKYLIYIHNDIPGDYSNRAIFLYNVATGESKQLTPYPRDPGAEYVPLPDDLSEARWTDTSLSYEADGKTWKLDF